MIQKSAITARIAKKLTNLPERKVTKVVNRLFDVISEQVIDGNRIEIRGFGCFNLRYQAPKKTHNPMTLDKISKEASYKVHFKPGKALREKVNDTREKS